MTERLRSPSLSPKLESIEMIEENSLSEANPLDLLNQLEQILETDAKLDEVGFIHPSQFVALSEEAGGPSLSSVGSVLHSTDGTIKSKISEVNFSKLVFWSKDHKLGISTLFLLPLYNAAKDAFMAALEQYKMLSNLYRKKNESEDGNAVNFSLSSLNAFESEVMKHSRAVLLLSCDFGTAWNARKLVVSKKQHFPVFLDELLLSALVLSYSPKSERAWNHRRWVIKIIAGKRSNLQEIVERESELVKKIAEKSKMNYRAWNHRCWLVSYMSRDQVLHEFKKSQDWAGLHVADNSCFHYRTRLMLRMLEDSCHRQDSIACFSYCAELYEVWKEELNWNEMLIKRYIGREALWLHRRFLSICWINHFARTSTGDVSCHIDHRIGIHCDLDVFMNNELQLFRSCTTILDDDFEDYQAQATYSATYILWLTKQISARFGFELQKQLRAGELELLLSKVPEKTYVWDFLGVECGSK